MKGLFFGLLTVDLHFFTDNYPEENTKTKARQFDSYIGGPATNAAITYQHLGSEAKLISSIGQNSFSAMIWDHLDQHQLETTDLRINEKIDPVFASILTNEISGSRTILSYHPKPLLEQPIPDIDKDVKIALFDGFYMDQAIILAKECKKQNIITVFDGGSWKRNTDTLLEYIDIAICSKDFHPPGTVKTNDVISFLLKSGVKKTAITRGAKAIIFNEGEANLLVNVPEADVIDTLGAGDIFHGAFCHYFAQGDSFDLALKKASEIAALSCQHKGPRKWMHKQS